MNIKRSTLYYRAKDNLNKKIKEADIIKDKIATISYKHPYYGYRRMTAQLKREKVIVNHKRVLRMMRELGIQGRIKRRYISTTNSRHHNRIYPDLTKNLKVHKINQLWCADITYIRILNGFVYLAAIIDVYSRRIVGYAIGKTLCPKLTVTALSMAIANRDINNLVHHSDQGIQYTCKEYINILKTHHIKISMSAKGNPYDNAFVESFFKTLKQEEVYLWEYESFSDVINRIPYFIEDVYNKKRLHSSLGYRPPEEYERLFAKNDSQECIMVKTISV